MVSMHRLIPRGAISQAQASRRQHVMLGTPHLAELVESCHALGLLHVAVEATKWYTRPQLAECLKHKAHLGQGSRMCSAA